MKELDEIVENLYEYLSNKETELMTAGDLSSYKLSLIANRKADIDFFKESAAKAVDNPVQKKQVIENFFRDSDKIKTQIDQI